MAWWTEYVEKVVGVQGGEPVIRGTRTPVRTVAALYFHVYDKDLREVAAALPHLTSDEIQAAVSYYKQNEAEIEAINARHERARDQLLAAS